MQSQAVVILVVTPGTRPSKPRTTEDIRASPLSSRTITDYSRRERMKRCRSIPCRGRRARKVCCWGQGCIQPSAQHPRNCRFQRVDESVDKSIGSANMWRCMREQRYCSRIASLLQPHRVERLVDDQVPIQEHGLELVLKDIT
jgi:hypothetical protein